MRGSVASVRALAYQHVDDCETFEQLLAVCRDEFPIGGFAEGQKVVLDVWNEVRVKPVEDRMRALVEQLEDTEATEALVGAGDCGAVPEALRAMMTPDEFERNFDRRRKDFARVAEVANKAASSMAAGAFGLKFKADPRMPAGLFALVKPTAAERAAHERFMRFAEHVAARRQVIGALYDENGREREVRRGCSCKVPDEKPPLNVCPIAFELDGDDSFCACCDECRRVCGDDI